MNRKKYNPTKTIEEGGDSTVEHSYIKFPREAPIPVSRESTITSVKDDGKLIKENLKKRGKTKYTHIHTHPYSKGYAVQGVPSGGDLSNFYSNNRRKNMVIAQRDDETGKVQGYVFLSKGKKEFPITLDRSNAPINYMKKFPNNLSISYIKGRKERKEKLNAWKKDFEKRKKHRKEHDEIFDDYQNTLIGDREQGFKKLKNIVEEKDWGLKFVPTKGYRFSKETGNFEKSNGLEKAVSAMVGGFFAGALLSFSPKITGNIIIESMQISNNGTFFIISSLIFSVILYFLLRKH